MLKVLVEGSWAKECIGLLRFIAASFAKRYFDRM